MNAEIDGRAAGGHDHGGAAEIATFYGQSDINAIDFVWKWAPNGNNRERNFKFQAEYFERDEEGRVDMVPTDGSAVAETSSYKGKQKGGYVQAVYQFMPRWRVGYRYDQLEATNTVPDATVLDESGLDSAGHTPKRSTIMLDYSHSEYSRIRVQFAKDDSYADTDNLFFVQYIMSLGSHGAHRF
jgi:hypothetical protein